ncbi:hypothetical protein GUJ93_ZPchr0009g318 [Zizania palustris]|uniref:Uncharacterized protein n=1 Tax=Zizania palustris TaxID=103762 RepID=A0A8J5S657_ZIZPA|nr:hypothetical protein GUJ93_ZPchr0009g318 [Zizania palustris]
MGQSIGSGQSSPSKLRTPGGAFRSGSTIGGYSALPFHDGIVVALDGDPKESWMKPTFLIVAGLLVPAMMMAMVLNLNRVLEPLRSSRVANTIIISRVRMRPRAS